MNTITDADWARELPRARATENDVSRQIREKVDELKPGSDAAIAAGCNCPVMDNARGRGWLCSGMFVMRDDCPIHGLPAGEPSQPDGEHAGTWPAKKECAK